MCIIKNIKKLRFFLFSTGCGDDNMYCTGRCTEGVQKARTEEAHQPKPQAHTHTEKRATEKSKTAFSSL
jgi:hypothetical protein